MSTFKHINAAQQIIDGTITSSLFAPGAVTVAALNIDGNVNFNEYQALEFRIENVSSTPAAGNLGRVIYNTTTNQFLIDNGTAFVPVSSSGAVTGIYSDTNPVLAGTIQFVSGTNVTLSQVGQAITISSTGSGGGVSSLNSLTGAVTLVAGSNVTITPFGNNLTIAATASPITTGNLTDSGTDGIVITGGTGAVVGTGTSIAQHVADSSHNGYLSSTDWSSFSAKQPAGSYITALTGDATASGPGSAVLTLANTSVTPGSYTNTNLTVDSKGRITAASSGSSPVVNYQQDLFDVSTPVNPYVLTLSQTPISQSEQVSWNGMVLRPGLANDYTIVGNTITLNTGIVVKLEDTFLVSYTY